MALTFNTSGGIPAKFLTNFRAHNTPPSFEYTPTGSLVIAGSQTPSKEQTAAIRSAVTDLVGMQGKLIEDQATEAAQKAAATGAEAEINAYTTAGGIAAENARLTEQAGKVQQLQQERELALSLGQTNAQVATAGRTGGGSSLDLLKMSVRQGYLQQQISASQTAITSGAYLEQEAASKAEVAGATTQLGAAQAYGTAAGEAAKTTQTNIDAETNALLGYVQQVPGLSNSPEAQLATAELAGFGNTGAGTGTNTGTDTTNPAMANIQQILSGSTGSLNFNNPYAGTGAIGGGFFPLL